MKCSVFKVAGEFMKFKLFPCSGLSGVLLLMCFYLIDVPNRVCLASQIHLMNKKVLQKQ